MSLPGTWPTGTTDWRPPVAYFPRGCVPGNAVSSPAWLTRTSGVIGWVDKGTLKTIPISLDRTECPVSCQFQLCLLLCGIGGSWICPQRGKVTKTQARAPSLVRA